MAETTTAIWFPASISRFTRLATWRMRSMPAIDVPPNFITMRAMDSCRSAGGIGGAALIGWGHGQGKRPPRHHHRSARGGAFRKTGGRLVGPQGFVGDAACAEPGETALHTRSDRPALGRRRMRLAA